MSMPEHLADVVDLDLTNLSAGEKRDAARRLAAADPALTGGDLARRFGMDARWGRRQAEAARREAPAGDRPGQPEVTAPAPPVAPEAPPPVAPEAPPPVRPAPPVTAPADRPAPPADRWYDTAVLVAGRWAVLLVAAALSYSHMRHLAAEAGEEGWRAAVWPVSVDGLLVVALVSLRRARRHGEAAPGAWAALVAALGASLAANVASAQPTMLGRFVAAWPPLVLLAVEVLGGRRRGHR